MEKIIRAVSNPASGEACCADPHTGFGQQWTLEVSVSAAFELTTAGAETRTLPHTWDYFWGLQGKKGYGGSPMSVQGFP